jgi:hypothetical protein
MKQKKNGDKEMEEKIVSLMKQRENENSALIKVLKAIKEKLTDKDTNTPKTKTEGNSKDGLT